MATTTPNAGYIKPDPDGSIGTWDSELNATIDLVDAHDHTTGKGVPVPVAGLNINADLPMAGFALTNARALDMSAVAAALVAIYDRCLFVNSADNELYWRTAGGVNVQLTSGNSLNAALLGGFTGDYGSGGSEANFNSGTAIFNFLRAANHRAFLDTSDIRLFQGVAGVTAAVKIRSPNSLAASYDFILPAALPASASLLRIANTGQVDSTRAPSLDSLSVVGTITSGPINCGNVTATSVATTLDVQTGGLFLRPARVRHIHPTAGHAVAGTLSATGWSAGAGSQTLIVPLVVQEGERITSVGVRVDPDDVAAISIDVRRQSDNTSTSLGTASSSGTAVQTVTVSGLTETVGGNVGTSYVVSITSGQNGDAVRAILITTDVV